MEPIIPLYSQGSCVDLDLVKQRAAERAMPSSLLPVRDSQGQFRSYTTPNLVVPDTANDEDVDVEDGS
jgi:hypothetical protein